MEELNPMNSLQQILDKMKLNEALENMEKNNPSLRNKLYIHGIYWENIMSDNAIAADRIGTDFQTNQPRYAYNSVEVTHKKILEPSVVEETQLKY